ncbi:hydroxylase [Amycolatopsis sp. lyj-84]|uniref:hydroxylase n=1 Tax=Amycolatopsis sp. lyj-84 TaxID=2789284 RepID=UPI0039790FD9
MEGTHTAPETLDFDGVTRLHITVTAGLADVGADLVERAVSAGVRRMTIVWGGYAGPTEQAMAESGAEWTRLEPQEFMSNALTWVDSVRADGVIREPFDLPSAVVHEADIGAVAATALVEDGHSGKVYNLTGPEALTTRERIAILGTALGRDLALERITRQQAIDRLLADGVSPQDAEYVIGWHSDPPVEARTVDDTVERVLGRPARTFAQWVKEYADRFSR